ncbi:MAG: serine hydrolase domain-containing protein [Gemmatimonadota bacterium]|nr:serine hydrolase domain-containing protein [Gemmatimonadota bacterium]
MSRLASLSSRAHVVALSLLVVAFPLAAQDGPAEDPEVQAQIRLFSAWLDGQIARRELPGVVVGVVAGDELVWAQGFGLADIADERPMTPQTQFRMASHSKLFTATAIMQLREEGKLSLDDPVSKYLPWFDYGSADPSDPPITIEHLLTHSSGLPRELSDHWTSHDFPTPDEVREIMPGRQAPFSPEVRWKYSNLAYTIAGMVVEEVSGMSWADYLQTNIFDPLGMSSSSVDIDTEGLATGYTMRQLDGTRDEYAFVDARGMAAATGLTSTIEDMARFVSAQFREGARGGDRILSTASLREMHRVRMLESTWTRGQGIGFGVSRVDGKIFVGHGGGYPGYTTQTSIQLDEKVGVIALTNTNDSNPGQIARQLYTTVGEAVAAATKPEQEKVAWDPAWERFAGMYAGFGGGRQQVVLMSEALVIIDPYGSNVDEPLELAPIGDGTFRYTSPTGGGPVGELIRFVEEDGEVVGMWVGDYEYERIES